MPVLEVRDLTYEYPNGALALDGISLTIPEGRKTVVIGSNGSGKSTLFLHFNGVLRPKQGEVLYAGRKVGYGPKELARLRSEVSVVLQNPDDQIFSTTVEEDIAFGPMNLGLPMKEVEARVDEALFLVDLQDVRARPSQQLSFGQRKRVALAGALAMKPRVLMMDEPTAGLDSRMVHELLELADELNQKGLTVIMSTHDVETAYEWADEIRVLHRGRLYFSGIPEDFFMDERRVHSLGFVAPTLFDLNRRAKDLTGKPLAPYPRTVEEAIHKIVPEACARVGKLRIVKVVVQPFQHRELAPSPGDSPSRMAIGVYGTMARKWAHDNGMKVDYAFNALESCVRETSQGRDFVMLVDDALIHMVQSRLRKLAEDFGLDIPVEVL